MSSHRELHPRISHLQGGMDAFHWRKAWLRPRKKQQRRSVRCCNEERHWNGCPCTVHDLVRLYALPAAAWVHILWSYREQQTERQLIAILVTRDVIDWLELCTCPFTVTFKCLRTKYSWMAADPRNPRTLNSTKIIRYICMFIVCCHGNVEKMKGLNCDIYCI